ncbi:hypothetical protein SCALM49S_08805 [Streptomyces californicus]
MGTTLRTAGRTVLFSALTVAVSLSAMLVFPQYFLRSFAYAGIAVVLLAAAAALILLPAALVLLGHRINSLDLRRVFRRRKKRVTGAAGGVTPEGKAEAGAPGAGAGAGADADASPGRGWARLAALVMRRAPVFAIVTTVGLLLLGLPFLGVKFGTADDRQLPAGAESRVVQEHIRDGFPGSPGGGLEVLAEGKGSPADHAELKGRIEKLPGVLRVEGPVAEGSTAYYNVLPEGEAVGEATQQLVRELRAVPSASSLDVSVTGTAAVLVDSKDAIADRLPWALAIIVVVTLLLVFLLTGSVLIPLQAVVLNALSLTAMFGALVWVFQDGNLSGLLGFTSTGDIETTLPVLMFCVAFGLSMDYGVFLIPGMKEEYDRTGDHERFRHLRPPAHGRADHRGSRDPGGRDGGHRHLAGHQHQDAGARYRPRRADGRHGGARAAGPRGDEGVGPLHLVDPRAPAGLPPEVRPQRRGVRPGRCCVRTCPCTCPGRCSRTCWDLGCGFRCGAVGGRGGWRGGRAGDCRGHGPRQVGETLTEPAAGRCRALRGALRGRVRRRASGSARGDACRMRPVWGGGREIRRETVLAGAGKGPVKGRGGPVGLASGGG